MKRLFLAALFAIITISPANAQGEEWIKASENEWGAFLYDKSSVSTGEDGMIMVKSKQIFSKDKAEAMGMYYQTSKAYLTQYLKTS